jgi:single-strand DNA-binding protein
VPTGETGSCETNKGEDQLMNDTQMTIVGNTVDTPKLRRTKNGHLVATFRVASNPRRFDRQKQAWVDGTTLFVSVTAWRALGENVAASLQKGQPVVVTGRYCQREYEQNETLKTAYELEASAVGHDLSRGVSRFEKVVRTVAATVELDAQGIPEDQTANYLDLDDEPASDSAEPEHEVDTITGEVRELTRVA